MNIAVLGAGGHTGRFVVQELKRRNVRVIAGLRPESVISEPDNGEVRPIAFDDPASLHRALEGASAVINCAGPFFETARQAAEAAIHHKIPYLDVAAEQFTVASLFDELDENAGAAGVTIVPAMAFFGGLADLLATPLVQPAQPVERVEVAVALDGWHPTAGTRRTGARNHYPRVLIRDGRLVPLDTPPDPRCWTFPEPFGVQQMTPVPLAEVILIHRHLRPRKMVSLLNEKPLADLRDASTPAPSAVDERGRSSQRFMVEVQVTCGGQTSRAIAAGRDIYAITAPLVVGACLELVKDGSALPGVRCPGELFDAAAFLSSLAPELKTSFEHNIRAAA